MKLKMVAFSVRNLLKRRRGVETFASAPGTGDRELESRQGTGKHRRIYKNILYEAIYCLKIYIYGQKLYILVYKQYMTVNGHLMAVNRRIFHIFLYIYIYFCTVQGVKKCFIALLSFS
jgi:hypothetical protein